MNVHYVKSIRIFAVQLIIMSGILFLLHTYLYSHFGDTIVLVLPIWQIYLFQIIVVFSMYAWISYNHHNGKKELFNLFMAGTLIKVVVALVFLLPVFLSDLESKRPDVFNFFIPYFVFLAFEMFSITRLINKSSA